MEPEGSLPHSQVPVISPCLSQIEPVHASTSHMLKINFNSIHPSTPGSSKWSLSIRFPHQIPVCTSPLHTCYMPRPSHSEQYRTLSSSLCSFLHSHVNSSHLGRNIFLSTLFWNATSLWSFPNVRGQFSHPYTTTGKMIVSELVTKKNIC